MFRRYTHHSSACWFAAVAVVFSQFAIGQDSQGYALNTQWETDGFSMPESVVSIPGHDWLYVSNVNGDDKPGFISRVSKGGAIDKLKWVEGIQTPTGMAAYDGDLYVVDQKQVHQINIDSGEITQSYKSQSATSLNDIDITSDGDIYVSELTGGAIHRVEDEEVVKWVSSDLFPFPNGVMVGQNGLYVGNVGDELTRDLTPDRYGAISKISFADQSVEMLEASNRMGTWDGLAPFADGMLASSPFNGELWYFHGDQKSLIGKSDGGIADIGTDPEAGIVYAPLLFGNKVVAYQLEGFSWTRISTADGFADQVVDQLFGDDAGESVAKSDGTIAGNFGGQELVGTWEWDGELFCRDSKLGDMNIGLDCLVIEVTDSQMRLTLQKGMGPSVIYDRK